MSRLRVAARSAFEISLSTWVARRLGRFRRKGSRLVLCYHNVVEQRRDGGDRSLHLALDLFEAELDLLRSEGASVVPLDAPPPSPGSPPEVAITFDDAYAEALRLAVPALAARGMPATMFVAPGILGAEAMWWDLLAEPNRGGVAEELREHALRDLDGDGKRVLSAATAGGWRTGGVEPEFRIGTERELQAALDAHPRLTLGAHSWSHANLARLHGDRLRQELVEPLRWLEQRWPDRTLRWIAFPYGLWSEEAFAATLALGYRAALAVTGGWWRDAAAGSKVIPRFNVTAGLSLRGFSVRVGGAI